VCASINNSRNIMPGFGSPPDGPPPPELNYDMFLGPAPKRPYNPNRSIYHFRWFWDYSAARRPISAALAGQGHPSAARSSNRRKGAGSGPRRRKTTPAMRSKTTPATCGTSSTASNRGRTGVRPPKRPRNRHRLPSSNISLKTGRKLVWDAEEGRSGGRQGGQCDARASVSGAVGQGTASTGSVVNRVELPSARSQSNKPTMPPQIHNESVPTFSSLPSDEDRLDLRRPSSTMLLLAACSAGPRPAAWRGSVYANP